MPFLQIWYEALKNYRGWKLMKKNWNFNTKKKVLETKMANEVHRESSKGVSEWEWLTLHLKKIVKFYHE